MPIEPHKHGTDDLLGDMVQTADWALSAADQHSILQRGSYTLAAGTKFITLPYAYLSAGDGANNLIFMATSKTTNGIFIESISTKAFGDARLSAISGFTLSGSGADTGFWFCVGYK